jgi:glutamyl-tRNA synthetase
MKTRIAPSPTGDPHVGTAYQALFNYVFAHQHGGAFIVRIEDTDRARFNPESQTRILEMLEWLGLHPDESPAVGGPSAPYIQTERAGLHQAYAAQLLERGAAYRAFDTPAELEARRKASEAAKSSYRGYDRRDRDLSREESDARAAAGEAFVIRLKAPLTGEVVVKDGLRGDVVFQASELDDKVLLKADGFPTYHLAAMCDDHDMGVTHVIRAEEWLTSTPIHVLIIEAFGWEKPQFIHTALLRNADKSKLSKRKSNTSVDSYRELGIAPEALLNYLGMMAFSMPANPDGSSREVFSVADLIEHFTWERVGLTGPVFDLEKLKWLNGKYIREVFGLEEVVKRALPFLERAGFDVSNAEYLSGVVGVLRERFDVFSELPEKARYFFEEPVIEEKAKTKLIEGRTHLEGLLQILEGSDWTHDALELALKGYAEAQGAKLGAIMQPLRAAVTGRLETPGMYEVLLVLGREKSLERVKGQLLAPSS